MRIFLTGGTGLIGSRLLEALVAQGDEVTALTRSASSLEKIKRKYPSKIRVIAGDLTKRGLWQKEVANQDTVISLAGESLVGRRWTKDLKQRMYDSRVIGTKHLVESIELVPKEARPRRVLLASATGYYGDQNDAVLTEESNAGSGFLSKLCVDWEAEARRAETFGAVVTLLRFGVVLDPKGGALQKMLPAFRFFVGGPIGSGKQYISWIHYKDVAEMILFILRLPEKEAEGPFNLTAPHPVTMKQFATSIGNVLKRPAWFSVPEAFVKLLFGEAAKVILEGQQVFPKRAEALGYQFRYTYIEEALRSLLRNDQKKVYSRERL